MRNTYRRLAFLARMAAVAAVALGVATPVAAQGFLKKKLKQAAGQEGASRAAEAAGATPEAAGAANAPAPGGGARGGTVVLTEDVVKQLLAGLKAGQAERAAAAKEDTPYGRYRKAEAAYAEAKSKCDAAQQTWPNRAASDEKMMNKYSAMMEKMSNAQQKGDQKLAGTYVDSAMSLVDPACVVKQPKQEEYFGASDGYYDAQRKLDERAEQAEMKSSGLDRGELSMAKERTDAILRGAPGPDVSASEKSAVNSHADELKRALGIQEVPAARAAKPAPAAAPAPAPAPAGPTLTPGQRAMSDCMAQNVQKHEKEIEALGNRGVEAQKAGDQATMMAIADSIQRLQMAGCMAGY